MTSKSRLRKLVATLCLIGGLAAFGSGFAQDGGVSLDNAVYQEVQATLPNGTVETRRVPATKVVPGETVIYEISYRNAGTDEATDVVIGIPVPRELEFVDNGDTPAAEVSVDGGEQYGALAELSVAGADGNPRPAQASDITNLRWDMGTLAPGASGAVSFRARVK